jgi:hypothetical protein
MRRKKALWGGRALSIVVAIFVGYLVAGWNPSASHNNQLSAAQMVALRFPQDFDDASSAPTVMPVAATSSSPLAEAQAALLSPTPMMPQTSDAPAQVASQIPQTNVDAPVAQAPVQVAMAEQSTPAPVAVPAVSSASSRSAATPPQPVAAQQSLAKKVAAAAHRALNERPGFVLNDAQIASIKERLHLTPDQEEMWPAVEAALRNLAYTRAREARRKGEPANVQIASADPNSSEVQGLKSAAIPLIMSFNSEQKDEVRNIAHVMGLDQLASQF